MTSIIQALLPLALNLISMAIQKHILNQEQKQAFLDFIQAMAEKGNTSSKIRDQFIKLHEKLKSN
jgi:hypothetical protein